MAKRCAVGVSFRGAERQSPAERHHLVCVERPKHGAPRQSKNARSAKRPSDLPNGRPLRTLDHRDSARVLKDPGHPLPRNPRERSWPKRGAVWRGKAERVGGGGEEAQSPSCCVFRPRAPKTPLRGSRASAPSADCPQAREAPRRSVECPVQGAAGSRSPW